MIGMVDVKELIAGLEGQLRQDFIKRMTKTMKRKPTKTEVDEKISEMPGGALLPVEVSFHDHCCCCWRRVKWCCWVLNIENTVPFLAQLVLVRGVSNRAEPA